MINTVFTRTQDGYRWLDSIQPASAELGSIAEAYALHPTSVQDCLQPEHLPKFERFDNAYFLIVRAYDEKCPVDADTVQELTRKIAIFWNAHFFITIHRQDQLFMEGMRNLWSVPGAQIPAEPSIPLLHDLIKRVLISYEAPLEAADSRLDEYEEQVFVSQSEARILQELYLLKRKATVFKKMIFLTKDVLKSLNIESRTHRPLVQDLIETADRLFFLADQLLENTNTLLSMHISLSSQRTNEVMRVLTLFSVFFLPLTFIVGIYGMNFKYMPELYHPLGYPLILFVMLLVVVGVFLWFRRKGWLGSKGE
ncbi:MAG TPA: CorA family divalent cation transporter [bacterium]|mgnify:FL=1|nr:CorA family divalent cation transporter [bacterium]HOZ21468.1 CorA family divalent cation transporter [bacterium]